MRFTALKTKVGLSFILYGIFILSVFHIFHPPLLVSIVTVLIIGLIFSLMSTSQITRPITQFEEIARKAASGNLNVRSKVKPHSEFRALSESFNQMIDGFARLIQISQLLSKEHDLDRLLNLIISETKKLMHAERATLFLYNEDTKELWSYVVSELEIKEIRLPLGKGIGGYVAQTGEIINLKDAYSDEKFDREVDKITGFHTRNILCVPMFDQKGKILGVIQVLNKLSGAFSEYDESLLTAISTQAAIAIENTGLYASKENLFRSLIKTIVATIDARDPVTSGHSERVARYSLALGKTMDLNREELGILEYAALLHDVGKIGIRDEILSKPGRYTPEEYEAVKRHPIISKDILEKAYFTGNQKQIPFLASSHHEKLDGTGYPLGLRADQIPTIARIIAVTDVYDALVSYDRPYKPSMSIEKAIEILKEESLKGRFDRDMVELFITSKLYELEKRQSINIAEDLSIAYRLLSQEEWRAILPMVAKIRDIGKTGLLFITKDSLPLNGFMEVRIHKSGFTIDVLTKIVHRKEVEKGYEVGINFINMSSEGIKNLQKHIVDFTQKNGDASNF
jgi:HD-GYP domain-containing protein (c-di-GMP phosphodiesterase class II)